MGGCLFNSGPWRPRAGVQGPLDAEEPMVTEAERLARLEGAYNHLATKADLANLETRLTKWFAGLLLLVVINVLGTVTGILIALLG